MIFRILALSLAALSLMGAAPPALAPVDPQAVNRIRGHVQFLASDDLEGRDTGSRAYRVAAQYVASQFAAVGLKPGGANGGWFLEVPFRKATHASTPTVTLVDGGQRTPLRIGQDVSLRPSMTQKSVGAEAPLVFVGRGIKEPALGIDDYAGVDARGKIVVVMAGTPSGLRSDVAAHLHIAKEDIAKAAGAVGLIELPVPGVRSSRQFRLTATDPRIDWVKAGSASNGFLDVEVTVSKGTGEKLLRGSRFSFDRLADLASKGGKLPAFDLPARLAVAGSTAWEDFTSPQVIGLWPGSDPKLSVENIILMGHLDHVGIKEDAKLGEDRIYNGALDNAAGIATMLEAARKFSTSGQAPRRSMMFVANTGEEKGLLGADYFAEYSRVPARSIVGLVNLDMPLLLYDFTDVIAFGAEHSTIAGIAQSAAASMNVALASDPMPQETLFVRSDHYRFVERGVPSIFLMTGHANGGKKAWDFFLQNNYHKVSDDLSQPIFWNAAARFADLNYRIARALANADQRPMWFADSYFGDRFGAGQPKAAR